MEYLREELIRCHDGRGSDVVGNVCGQEVGCVLGDDEVGAAGDGCGKVVEVVCVWTGELLGQ